MGLGWPALTFTPYGLAGEWDAPRWLAMLDGRLGHPATGVQLQHGWTRGRDPERPWVRITSLRKDRYDELKIDRVAVPADAADHAMFALTDVTMPEPLVSPDDYRDRITEQGRRQARRHGEWPRTTWTIDDEAVPASVFRFAGAWAGFTTAGTAADVIVLGFGIEPDGLALTGLNDTSAYHFDRHRAVTFPQTLQQSQGAALARLGGDWNNEPDRSWPAHPDHAAALRWL